jgi:hypothetical protein
MYAETDWFAFCNVSLSGGRKMLAAVFACSNRFQSVHVTSRPGWLSEVDGRPRAGGVEPAGQRSRVLFLQDSLGLHLSTADSAAATPAFRHIHTLQAKVKSSPEKTPNDAAAHFFEEIPFVALNAFFYLE